MNFFGDTYGDDDDDRAWRGRRVIPAVPVETVSLMLRGGGQEPTRVCRYCRLYLIVREVLKYYVIDLSSRAGNQTKVRTSVRPCGARVSNALRIVQESTPPGRPFPPSAPRQQHSRPSRNTRRTHASFTPSTPPSPPEKTIIFTRRRLTAIKPV